MLEIKCSRSRLARLALGRTLHGKRIITMLLLRLLVLLLTLSRLRLLLVAIRVPLFAPIMP